MNKTAWIIFGLISTIALTYFAVQWLGDIGYLAFLFFPCELFFIGAMSKQKEYTYSTKDGLKVVGDDTERA